MENPIVSYARAIYTYYNIFNHLIFQEIGVNLLTVRSLPMYCNKLQLISSTLTQNINCQHIMVYQLKYIHLLLWRTLLQCIATVKRASLDVVKMKILIFKRENKCALIF
jgi:hypothetical protein